MPFPKWAFAVIAVLVIVLLAVVFATCPGRRGPPPKSSLITALAGLQPTSAEAAKFYWPFSMREGIPFISVRLQSQPDRPITCVLDSGSGHLNVASQDCNVCDARHGVYVSSVHTGRTKSLAYGTQEDTVTVRRDQLLVTDRPQAFFRADTAEAVDVEVHVTVDRTRDSSNFNVFGVSNTGFLSQLLGPDRALMVCFKPGNLNGFVTNVTSAEAKEYRACAVANAPLQSLMGLPFYTVRLKAIRIGGVAVPTPRYCILDTGSNVISYPPQTFAAIADNVGVDKRLEIVFGDAGPDFEGDAQADGGKLVVPYLNYTFGFQLMMDDDVPDFGIGPVMVLGCNGMLGYTFIFERKHLSVVVSSKNVCDGVHRV
jgi:hypothetical protein